MRLLPSIVLNPETPDGERRVRGLIQSAAGSPGAFAIHSLNLPDHHYKRYGEADFVVVDSRGLLVLEVKGGIVRFSEGEWRFENGRGQLRRRSEGPHRQAESGVQALVRTLVRLGSGKPPVFGWAVVLPFTHWIGKHPEIPADVIIDRTGCEDASAFTSAIDRVYRWWRSRCEESGRRVHPLDVAEYERRLVPEFQFAPAPARSAAAIEQDIVRLTERQAEILEGLGANPRLVVQGGAGTGKTVLASAAALHEANSGASVALVAGAPILAAHLAQALSNVTVVAPSEVDELPARSIDTLVVDEGQELTNPEGLESLDRILRGGIDTGRWRWFMDPANQALHACVDESSMARLQAAAAAFRLSRNVRSTRQIVSLVKGTIGADVGVSEIDGRGVLPHVEQADGDAQAIERAVELAAEWKASAVRPAEIAILAAADDVVRVAEAARTHFGEALTVLTLPEHLEAAAERAIVTEPSAFRGMERPWSAVACTSAFSTLPRSESFLYVAMTRARAGLAVVLGPDAARWFSALQEIHSLAVLGTAAGEAETANGDRRRPAHQR